MKPYTTIKLHTCYICRRLYGPTAGHHIRLRVHNPPAAPTTSRPWTCDNCIALLATECAQEAHATP